MLMPIVVDPAAYYSEDEWSELSGLAKSTLRRKRRENSELPFSRYGRQIWYRGADILAALEAERRRSTSDFRSAKSVDRHGLSNEPIRER